MLGRRIGPSGRKISKVLVNKDQRINYMVDHWSVPLTAPMVRNGAATVVFHHSGVIDRTVIEELLTTAETASFKTMDSVSLRKRMFSLLVEGLENIQRHTPPALAPTGFALLLREGPAYRCCLGNALPLASAAQLSHRVEMLNAMDEADLREYYLKILANEARTERGGAGLGLLTMARRGSRPMLAHSIPRDAFSEYLALEFVVT